MLILAADPGVKGAMALVCPRRGLLWIANLPIKTSAAGKDSSVKRAIDGRKLADTLRTAKATHGPGYDWIGVVERMTHFGIRERAPVNDIASMAHSSGLIEGVMLATCCSDVLRPLPKQWKAMYGLGSDKAGSRKIAGMLWPVASQNLITRHDHAEAALIAHWALGQVHYQKEAA